MILKRKNGLLMSSLLNGCKRKKRLKQEKVESVHLATTSHDNVANRKMKRNSNRKRKGATDSGTSQLKVQQNRIRSSLVSFPRKMDM